MKWFKHMTDAFYDEKIQLYLGMCGRSPMEGYGFYWGLLEMVAAQMDKSDKCSVTYPEKMWPKLLGLHHNKWGKYISACEVSGLVSVEYVNGNCKVTIPNLLKIRDNHTKNLQATCKQEVEVEVDIEATHNSARALAPPNHDSEKLKSDFQKIYDAGCELFPNLAPADTSSIHIWIKSGCDPSLDVIPTIKRFAGKSITTWKYFTNAIADAKATRLTPMPEGRSNATNSNKPQQNHREVSFNALYNADTGHERSYHAPGGEPNQRQQFTRIGSRGNEVDGDALYI